MKLFKILLLSVFSLMVVLAKADLQPHVVATPAAPHPKALLKSIDVQAQTLTYDWLNADEQLVDSGNSIVHFTAVDATAPTDTELITAVTTVPPPAPLIGVWTPLEFIARFTDAEFGAIMASTDITVVVARTKGIAATEIRTDDPRTSDLLDVFVSKGLITSGRKTAILTP